MAVWEGWQWKRGNESKDSTSQHEGVQGATADGILHKGRKRLIAVVIALYS